MIDTQAMPMTTISARSDLPQAQPSTLPGAQGGVLQVQLLLSVDENANLTAAVRNAATTAAHRVVQNNTWQRTALATAPDQ